MSTATPAQQTGFAKLAVRRRALIVIALTLVGLAFLGYLSLASLFPPSIKVSPDNGSKDISIENNLQISTSWMRGNINNVLVKEISLDHLGSPIGEKEVDGRLEGDVFVRNDGESTLKPDSRYEVTVEGVLTELTLSGPSRRL